MLFQTCHTIAFFGGVTLQCIPVSAIWTLDENSKCINSTGLIYAGAALSILEDVVYVMLPIPELMRLNLSLKKRAALVFMFALGGLYVPLSSLNSSNAVPTDMIYERVC